MIERYPDKSMPFEASIKKNAQIIHYFCVDDVFMFQQDDIFWQEELSRLYSYSLNRYSLNSLDKYGETGLLLMIQSVTTTMTHTTHYVPFWHHYNKNSVTGWLRPTVLWCNSPPPRYTDILQDLSPPQKTQDVPGRNKSDTCITSKLIISTSDEITWCVNQHIHISKQSFNPSAEENKNIKKRLLKCLIPSALCIHY